MSCRKIASNLLWTPDGYLRRPLITADRDGRIREVAVCETPDRCAGTEFHAGILVPAFVDAAALIAPDGTQTGMPDFFCLTAGGSIPFDLLSTSGTRTRHPFRTASADGICGERLPAGGAPEFPVAASRRVRICIGADPSAADPLRSMLDVLRAVPDVPLHARLAWATLNGAAALGIAAEAGRVEAGRRCGLCLLSGLDYETLTLTDRSTLVRIL